jgi:hypothetical protein
MSGTIQKYSNRRTRTTRLPLGIITVVLSSPRVCEQVTSSKTALLFGPKMSTTCRAVGANSHHALTTFTSPTRNRLYIWWPLYRWLCFGHNMAGVERSHCIQHFLLSKYALLRISHKTWQIQINLSGTVHVTHSSDTGMREAPGAAPPPDLNSLNCLVL